MRVDKLARDRVIDVLVPVLKWFSTFLPFVFTIYPSPSEPQPTYGNGLSKGNGSQRVDTRGK